jgi:hypothetical protein
MDDPSFSYVSNSFCQLDANPTPSIQGLIGGVFTSSIGVSLDSISGVIDLSKTAAGNYTITYATKGTCPTDTTISIAVASTPSVTSLASFSETVCKGSSFSAKNFFGSPGSSFSWKGLRNDIGLASSGNGNIPSFVSSGTITGGGNIVDTIIVTPSAGTCIGVKDTFYLTVKALDDATFTYPSNSFCSTLDPNPIANITGKSGGVFTSLPALPSLNPANGFINLATSPKGIFNLTYTTGTCSSKSTIQISIGDNPGVSLVRDKIQCLGSEFDSINFITTPGTTVYWTNNNPSIGLPASGVGTIPSFIAQGASLNNLSDTAVITLTPKVGSCAGATVQFRYIVNYLTNNSIEECYLPLSDLK